MLLLFSSSASPLRFKELQRLRAEMQRPDGAKNVVRELRKLALPDVSRYVSRDVSRDVSRRPCFLCWCLVLCFVCLVLDCLLTWSLLNPNFISVPMTKHQDAIGTSPYQCSFGRNIALWKGSLTLHGFPLFLSRALLKCKRIETSLRCDLACSNGAKEFLWSSMSRFQSRSKMQQDAARWDPMRPDVTGVLAFESHGDSTGDEELGGGATPRCP
jgi:hypothetical protein